MLEHNRHHASTVDLLIQGEFGWDPEEFHYALQQWAGPFSTNWWISIAKVTILTCPFKILSKTVILLFFFCSLTTWLDFLKLTSEKMQKMSKVSLFG